MTDTQYRAEARVTTAHASRYLQQLCKHFQHKLPATFNETAGSITFALGETKLAADAETLTLAVESKGEAELAQLEDVVARHLVRFAFRETLEIEWRPAA